MPPRAMAPASWPASCKALRALCPDHPVAVDLLLPTALPEHTSAEAVAAAVPQGHRDFVQGLFAAHQRAAGHAGQLFLAIRALAKPV
jgi:hypothetical protein